MMFDISENDISGSESYLNVPAHLPKWVEKTLSYVGLDVGNHVDPRRIESYFQRVGISLACNDSLLNEA